MAIPDIGTNEQGRALVCRHGIEGIPPSAEIDRWYYVNDEEGDEVEVTGAEENGFTRTREQSEGSVRLERDAGVFPLEGTYKCKVNDDSITVELYWPGKIMFNNWSRYYTVRNLERKDTATLLSSLRR